VLAWQPVACGHQHPPHLSSRPAVAAAYESASRRRLVRFSGIGGPFRMGRPPVRDPLDLAVEDLVGDGLEGGADRAGRDPLQGGARGADLGLGGVAGLGEGR
jgi:hypothetical protein